MKEIVPSEPDFNERILEYSDQLSEILSDAAKATNGMNRVPRKYAQKERFMSAMSEAFEIIGGVPRLALWADRNPTEFYKILSKQIPGLVQSSFSIKANGPVTIVSAIPESFLDAEPSKVIENE